MNRPLHPRDRGNRGAHSVGPHRFRGLVLGAVGLERGTQDLAGRKNAARTARRRKGGRSVKLRLRLDLVCALLSLGSERLDAKTELLDQRAADEAAHGVRLPAGHFHDFGQRSSRGPAHQVDDFGLLAAVPRDVSARLAPGRAVSRRLPFGGDFFAFPLAGATSAAGFATSAARRSTAFQIREPPPPCGW